MALESEPDIVTIMLGTNDSKLINWYDAERGDDYARDYVDMVTRLTALPTAPKIYVMVPPPLFEPFPYNMQASVINDILPVLVRVIGSW